jgi:hypothetical protein
MNGTMARMMAAMGYVSDMSLDKNPHCIISQPCIAMRDLDLIQW